MGEMVFGSNSILPQTWFVLARSNQLKRGGVKRVQLLNQKISLFRTFSGNLVALKSRCPHLGADLSLGRVDGEAIICPFHNWKFDASGHCINANESSIDVKGIKTFSYPILENMGLIWVFNGPKPLFDPPEFCLDKSNSSKTLTVHGRIVKTHYNLLISNGLDITHWKYVHGMEFIKPPQIENVSEYHIRAQFHFLIKPINIWNRIVCTLYGNRLFLDYNVYGGSVCLVKGIINNKSIDVLFSSSPLENGKSIARVTFIFKNLGFFQKTFKLYYFQFIKRFIMLKSVLHNDNKILSSIDYHPGFTHKDKGLIKVVKQVNNLPKHP